MKACCTKYREGRGIKDGKEIIMGGKEALSVVPWWVFVQYLAQKCLVSCLNRKKILSNLFKFSNYKIFMVSFYLE